MEYSGNEFDVVVVGAGVMGSSTAYQLAKRGHKTLLLEQFDFLHHRGSSHGESRTLRGTYPDHYYYPLVHESSLLWEQAQSEVGYKVYFKTQNFDMGLSDEPSLRSIIANCQKNSVWHDVLHSSQVSERFSGRLEIPDNWLAVVTELGGVIKPTKAVSMFQTLAILNGACLKDNMEVKTILKDNVRGGVIVVTSSGENFRGKKCVVTAGAWVGKLVKTISGIGLPIQPLEARLFYWRIKEGYEDQYAIQDDFPTFACYGKPCIYGTPSFEYPGLIKVTTHGGCPCEPDKRVWGPGMDLDYLKEWIAERFGGRIDASRPVATQSCMYSMTPDEDFVIDFLDGEFGKDVVIGGGFSGHAFKMAPVIGRTLADLALDAKTRVELSHFKMDRFKNNLENF